MSARDEEVRHRRCIELVSEIDNVHIPIMVPEILEYLAIRSGGVYGDVTGGGGGHSQKILESLGEGQLFIFDRDEVAVDLLKKKFAGDERVKVFKSRFSELARVCAENKVPAFDGLLADLGISSNQLELCGRGISFLKDEPLDMRLDASLTETAADVVNTYPAEELERIIRDYGEEKHARRLSLYIAEDRKSKKIFETSGELKRLAEISIGKFYRKERIHPATRLFMALRIFVNNELLEIESLMNVFPSLLNAKGRALIMSFHSLEDRIVKTRFRSLMKEEFKILTKRPLIPSEEEQKINSRSRSAKLRVIECNSMAQAG